MNQAESHYLNDISTHLPEHVSNKSSVFISDKFSVEFVNEIKNLLGDSNKYTHGDNSASTDKFDVAIDYPDKLNTARELYSYIHTLNPTGILVLGLKSRQPSIGNNRTYPYTLPSHKETRELEVIFREPSGKFTHINSLSESSLVNKTLRKIGKILPNSTLYSPYQLIIYKKGSTATGPYQSAHSLKNRLGRVKGRVVYKVRNHKINDFIIKIEAGTGVLKRNLKSILLINSYNFSRRVKPFIYKVDKSSKKHLVIVMTYLQIGGVERVMLNLIKGLDRTKFTVSLLTTVSSKNEWHDHFEPYVDTIVHVPDIIDSNWPIHYIDKFIEAFIVTNDADVIFITNSSAGYFALPEIKKQLPSVRVYDLLHTHGTPRDKNAYLRISMPYDKLIDRRVVISEYLKKYYVSQYPVAAEKISVIYNSLDRETLSQNKHKAGKDSLLDSISPEKNIITFIGRLEFDKSPLRLVEIANELKIRSIDACIMVIGDGSLRQDMEKRAIATDTLNSHIFFYGATDNPLPVMQKSNFSILVSNAEGIPMSILESMSVETPAIASSVGGIPEIIEHGKDGFLVEISDVEEEEKISRFVDNIIAATSLSDTELASMKKSSRKKILTKFSHMTEEYEELFLYGDKKK